MLAYAHFLISLLFAASAAADGGDPAPYQPSDLFLLNCGASSDTKDLHSRTWTVEDRKLLDSNPQNASFSSKASVQDSSVPQVPFTTARIFRSEFTYSFPVSPGPKFLRLYFYPTRYDSGFDAATSFLSVTVNGFSLLKNYSAYLTVMGSDPAAESPSRFIIKEFIVPVDDKHQMVNLTFMPSGNSTAFVNGVEIVSMPVGLYTSSDLAGVSVVGSSQRFILDNTTAFETVYRLNVGGTTIADVDDTGLYRAWTSDTDNIFGSAFGFTPLMRGVQIKYTKSTPAYVAPETVYTTYRTMGRDPQINMNYNLTWYFTVDSGFNYLMRLHFCETMPEVTKENQRVFSVFIQNQTAVIGLDVIQRSGGPDIPMYMDFIASVLNKDEERQDIWLALHPYMATGSVYADAILNGLEIFKVNNSDGSLVGPNLKPVDRDNKSSEPNRKVSKRSRGKGSHVMIIALAVVGCTLGVAFIVFAVLFVRRTKREVKDYGTPTTSKTKSLWGPVTYSPMSTHTNASSLPSNLCRRFSIIEIKAATSDFDSSLVIGTGGFGKVYKGRIEGSTIVAIKRLDSSSSQGVNEFETELKMLSKLRHLHLVSLIGYCDDDNEMILVYEYMPRGTLREHLYKKDNKDNPPLSWKRRLEICLGAARGIHYLHTGAKHPIIHRDIKSTNILLDENYVAKVSDFGLSKVGPTSTSQTHVSTVVKGSFGYVDPEYYRRQQLTEKSDVYSFGVVLFEVLCARPASIQGLPKDQITLAQWAKINHAKGTVDQIIDPHLTDDITRVSLDKFTEIATRCIHDQGIQRPKMNDVVWALEFVLQLHETAQKNKIDGGDFIRVERVGFASPRGEMGTTDDDDDFFSKSREHVSESATTDEKSLIGSNSSRSKSDAVFSEIIEPKGR